MDKWVNKVAVVTGCSAGIGSAIAVDLVKAGVIVVGLARRAEKIDALQDQLKAAKGKLHSFSCDVTKLESIQTAFSWIEKTFGNVHILVNNAGVFRNVKLLDTDDATATKLQETLDTNISGLVNCTREAFKIMKKNDDFGYIFNVNSVAGHKVVASSDDSSSNIYPGSKYAVTATTQVIRNELNAMKNKKIRVTSLSPGVVKTEIFEVAGFGNTFETYMDSGLMPFLKPEDVSSALMYMLSTPSSVNITELTIQPTGEAF